MATSKHSVQLAAPGTAPDEIHSAVIQACAPEAGLSWLDVGCGTGALLREIRDRYAPLRMTGVDVIDWLENDLRSDVEYAVGPAEEVLSHVPQADRVVLSESLEHMEAPWTVLRAAARKVSPGGRLVLSVPNIGSLRQRFSLLFSGYLASFSPSNEAHLTPILPHVAVRVLRWEGFSATFSFAGEEPLPLLGGRWPAVVRRHPKLVSLSLIVTAVDMRDRLAGSRD